jgi:uncharacterized protein (DUF1330 family)
MAAYLLVNVEKVKDPEKVQAYGKQVEAHTEKHGGKLVGSSANPEILEGSLDCTRSLVIEFPDMAALKSWYDAPEYQPMKALRQEGIDATLWVIDGA